MMTLANFRHELLPHDPDAFEHERKTLLDKQHAAVAPDTSLAERVEEERREGQSGDLLSEDAPSE